MPTACRLYAWFSSGSGRMRVLLFTNYESRKAGELLATGKAAFCLHWKSLRRQIRVTGEVGKASPERSDDYFASRERGSRIGAWASEQSRPLDHRLWQKRLPRSRNASPMMCRARRTGAAS